MTFISYEDIEKIYGDVETFLQKLINKSSGCTWHHGIYGTSGVPGIWFSYDYNTTIGCDNAGEIVVEDLRL